MKGLAFESIKKMLLERKMTPEHIHAFLEELRIFLQISRVKLESKDSDLRKTAVSELKELKQLLETNLLLKKYSSLLK